MNYCLLTNQIFPMKISSGLIEYVPGQSIELTDGKNYSYYDLFQFLKTQNNTQFNQPHKQFFDTFLESAAVYFVLSYLLNYGEKKSDKNHCFTKRSILF